MNKCEDPHKVSANGATSGPKTFEFQNPKTSEIQSGQSVVKKVLIT